MSLTVPAPLDPFALADASEDAVADARTARWVTRPATYRDVAARERAGETGGLSRRGGNVLGLCVCDGPYGPDDATRCVTCGGEL